MFSPRQFLSQEIVALPIADVWETLCRTDPMRLGRRTSARFEWTREQSLTCLEEMESGPFVRVWAGIELERAGRGTLVRAFVEITPRAAWAVPLLPLVGKLRVLAVLRACRRLQRDRQSGQPARGPGPLRQWLWRRRLGVYVADSPETAPLLDRLKQHLVEATDAELAHLTPYALADRWKVDRTSVLRLFLYAAHEGMLRYTWEVRCLHCRLTPVMVPSLDRLPPLFHCAHCGIDQETDLARNTELVFSVSARVRRVRPTRPKPVRHPARHPHTLAYSNVPSGASRTLRLTLNETALRVRAHGGHHACRVWPVPSLGRHVSRINLRFQEDSSWKPTGHLFRPGPVRFEVTNDSARDVDLAIDRAERDTAAVPAHEVVCRPEFRALFAADAPEPSVPLRAGVPSFLSIAAVDPIGICEDLGDNGAFCRLLAFERFVAGAVEREGGSILRRAHGSVLAVFSRTFDGMRAALALQKGLAGFNASTPHEPAIVMRIAIHAGPALATRAAGGHLDFFGHAIQHVLSVTRESQGGDIVFVPELLEHADVGVLLESERIDIAPFSASPPDSASPVKLLRASLRDVSVTTTFRVLLKR